MSRKLNILVVYVMNKYPMRATLWDQLYCFRNYSNHNCYYLNLSVRSVPGYLRKVEFDLIVFGTLILANRVKQEWFEPILEKARPLKALSGIKIAFPQDEHSHTNVLMDFLEEFDVRVVFSVGPDTEWPKLYDRIDFNRVKFYNVLTGYLDDDTVGRIKRLAAADRERDIGVGYRTWLAGPWLGRHGLLRKQIAEVIGAGAAARGFSTDISTRSEDTIWGDAWYEFLLRCKFTISVEGGSSVPDKDGTLKDRIESFCRQHPAATFEEVERNCFPGLDGSINYVALSPRHLEACATRTCQILIEGRYNDILEPGRHYLELKRDFSNLEQVLDDMQREELRIRITDQAYEDIAASGRHTYQQFVDFVVDRSLAVAGNEGVSASDRSTGAIYYWMRTADLFSWVQIALGLHSFGPRIRGWVRKALLSVFSEQTMLSVLGRPKTNKR